MTDTIRALLFVNRKASGSESDLEQGLNVLKGAGIEVVLERFDDPTAIPRRIRDERSAGIVIIGGGDGTLNAAVEAVLESGRPLGILPMGNANDLARTLDIPPHLPAACEIIAQGNRRWIDLGRVNGKYFFNVASIGLGARIAKDMNREVKRRWGVLGYLITAWNTLKRSRPFKVWVTASGKTECFGTQQIAVGNGRHYGGGMTVVDDAAIDSGRLDLYSVAPLPWWKLALLLPVLRWGKHRAVDDVKLLHGTEFVIETRRPMPINVDGELLEQTPATFEAVPKALQVFAPVMNENVEIGAESNRTRNCP